MSLLYPCLLLLLPLYSSQTTATSLLATISIVDSLPVAQTITIILNCVIGSSRFQFISTYFVVCSREWWETCNLTFRIITSQKYQYLEASCKYFTISIPVIDFINKGVRYNQLTETVFRHNTFWCCVQYKCVESFKKQIIHIIMNRLIRLPNIVALAKNV